MAHRLLIGNRWIESEETLDVVDPFTGEVFATAPLGSPQMIEYAIQAAATAFHHTRREPAYKRAELLERIAARIEAHREEFTRRIVREAGKPVTYAEAEVSRAVMTFRSAAVEARMAHGEALALDALPPGSNHIGLARRFPIGVIAAITPFNFPLNLVAHKVAPCIATGNTMVLKPASKTPLSALLLAEVLLEAEMPAGQVNVVTCSNEDAAALVRDERVKKISFTGSPAVGWKLKAECGRKKITLELGGNAGVIVHSDADLDAAIPAIATGAFASAGQSCISVQRIFIHETVYDQVRERLAAHVQAKIRTGDPTLPETVVGPMISRDALEKAKARIDAAVAEGATIVVGGNVEGTCLEATVLEDVPASAELCTEEAFAPLCTLHRYAEFEDALRLVNDSRFGLQAGVFTRDLQRAFVAFEQLEVGGVLINQVPTWRVENMPYGGVKESGFGREGLRYAMEEMTELRSLIVNLPGHGG